MIYERKDKGCKAKVLAVVADQVLIRAFWPATTKTDKRFNIVNGEAQNIVEVSKAYFERKYGVAL